MRRILFFSSLAFILSCNGDKGDDSTPAGEGDADTDSDSDSDADSDADSDTDTTDPATVPLAGPCPLETNYGGFLVDASPKYTIVDGKITDGVVPVEVLESVAVEGDCELLKKNNPFCDPTCAPDETCDFDGECIPYPLNQNLGTVTITGLTKPVVMEPPKSYNYFNTSLPIGALPPEALVTLQTEGEAYDPITLHGVGFDLLTPEKIQWTIDEGLPLTVTWDAPTTTVQRTEAFLNINIDQHGVTPITLFCRFADDGEGTVPASLLKTLISSGVTGFPNGGLKRRTVDSTAVGDGCAELVVSSFVEPDVSVIGYTPCKFDFQCPKGQTCNKKLERCE
jgi:hypothetical protein